jgi:hypothetical protein
MNHARKWLGALFTFVFLGLQASLAHAVPETGWWWNAAEGGRGYYIELKGDTLFLSAYFYADDGRPTWLVSNGPITGDRKCYDGRLYAVSGGGTITGPNHATGPETDVGAISLRFSDDNNGVLTWPGGTVNITRFDFAAGVASFQPTGWWWNAAQGGKGYSIEIQGNTLFMAGYAYDGAGNPVWYISSGQMGSAMHYAGTLTQASGGQTMGGPYKPATEANVGTVVIDFASLEGGTITFTDNAQNTSGPIALTPFLANPPLASLGTSWGGTYTGILVNDPPGVDTQTLTASGTVTWGEAAPGQQFPATATPNRAYVITGGTAQLHVTGTATVPLLGQSFVCTILGDAPVDLHTVFGASYLLFEANGTVTGQIATSSPIPLTVQATCQGPFGAFTQSVPVSTPTVVNYPIHGHHRYGHSDGNDPLHPVAENISAGATWNFDAVPGP